MPRTLQLWKAVDGPVSGRGQPLATRATPRHALSEAERVQAVANKPVLHGDKVSTLKATTVLAMLNWRGAKPSYSRLRVNSESA